MTMRRLQVLVWFLMPLFALLLMLVLMGARGGIWIVIPIILLILGAGIFYLMLLWARARGNGS
jgi:hypothetical protein